jgi:hypothetical protein
MGTACGHCGIPEQGGMFLTGGTPLLLSEVHMQLLRTQIWLSARWQALRCSSAHNHNQRRPIFCTRPLLPVLLTRPVKQDAAGQDCPPYCKSEHAAAAASTLPTHGVGTLPHNSKEVACMAHDSWPNLRNVTPCMLPLSTRRGSHFLKFGQYQEQWLREGRRSPALSGPCWCPSINKRPACSCTVLASSLLLDGVEAVEQVVNIV